MTVNDDGTVTLSMENLTACKPNQEIRCQVGIFPALEAPGDGIPRAADVATFESKWDGAFDGEKTSTTEVLNPGIYAVSSSCSLWEHDAAQLTPTSAKLVGSTANQPHFFVTLGGLF